MKELAAPLLAWYGGHKRSLPWRDDPSAYHIWISEIMLQQTRVEAVKEYYARFLAALPEIRSLAEAPEEKLLKLWEGLGYYNRARNLQRAARIVMKEHNGALPASYEELLRLPGIGAYTAGAIASIAYGEPVAAVDGNVLRVLARYLADESDIASEALKRRRKTELEAVMPPVAAGAFNQALMELGAIVCLPNGAPRCEECPLRERCRARAEGRTGELPVKAAKAARRLEKRTVFVIRYRDRVLIHRRAPKGLLAGMYELPAAEGHLGKRRALDYVGALGYVPLHIETLPESKHIFSHIEWRMRGYLVRADELAAGGSAETALSREGEYRLETPDTIEREYPIPSAFAAYAPYIRRRAEERQEQEERRSEG